MRRFIEVVLTNIKMTLHQPMKIVSLVIMPITLIFFINFGLSGSFSANTIVHFENSTSPMIEKIIKSDLADVVINDEKSIQDKLYTGKSTIAYFIPRDYDEQLKDGNIPVVIVHNLVEGLKDETLERFFEEYNKEILLDNELEKLGLESTRKHVNYENLVVLENNTGIIEADYFTTILMLMIFIMINSKELNSELVNMKKSNVLKRVITTPNTNLFQIGALMLSNLILMVFLNFIALIISSRVIGFSMNSYPLALAVIVSMCFVSSAIALAVFRLVNNEIIMSVIPIIISVGSTFMIMFYEFNRYNNPLAEVVGKISPYYWVMDVLDKNSLFPGIPILLLMGMVFLTAGSFRLREYAFK